MCKVYNPVGSLTNIKNHLRENNVAFDSIDELISFQKTYASSREQIVSSQKMLLTEERNNLANGILGLGVEIENDKQALQQNFTLQLARLQQQLDVLAKVEKTVIQQFTFGFKALFKHIQIYYILWFSKLTISRIVRPKVTRLDQKRKRYQYLLSDFEAAFTERGGAALDALDHKKRVIDEINPFIYGAIGEEKVVAELKRLPDDYILINDFTCTFDKPLYSQQQSSYIKSVQIDHLLVSPAGIFLIETKNWSKQSLQNFNLRSPVDQIKRTNFALYVLLKSTSSFKLTRHHWGDRKISIRNLIVLITHRPKEEFEFVKILALDSLVGYVKYFTPSLSKGEVEGVAEYLLRVKNA